MENEAGYYIRLQTFQQYRQAAECQLWLYHSGIQTIIEQQKYGYCLITRNSDSLKDTVQLEKLMKCMGFPAMLAGTCTKTSL